MDLNAVCVAIAQAVSDANLLMNGKRVTATAYGTEAIVEPHFWCADYDVQYDMTHGGKTRMVLTCRLLINYGDDKSAQTALQEVASSGVDGDIRAVLNDARSAPGQPALGGAADDLHLQRVRGPKLYDIGSNQYYGLEFTLLVIG